MKESLSFQFNKLAKLKREESKLRNHTLRKLRPDEWVLVNCRITEDEMLCFQEVRRRQINKFNNLLVSKEDKEIQQSKHNMAKIYNLEKEITGNNEVKQDNILLSYEEEEILVNEDEENCFQSNNFINISDKHLSVNHIKLLNRNLEFIPKDEFSDKLNIATEVELTMNRLNLQDNTFPSKVRKVLGNKPKLKDNLTAGERVALRELSQDKSTMIAQSDKGKVTIIMNKSEYDRKLYELLLNGDYDILKKDPSTKIEANIRKIAGKIKKENGQPNNVYHKIVGHQTRHPSIFANVKIHKSGYPLRIIISSYNSVTSNAALFTKNILDNMVENLKDEFMLKNIFQLKEDLKTLNIDWDNKLLLSIDVCNMYGSIDPDVAIRSIRNLVEKTNNFYLMYNVKPEDFLSLITIVLHNSYFLYENEFYKQDKGIPMGSSLSPVVSDIIMIDIEKMMKLLESFKLVEIYRRYRDDSFLTWNGNTGQAEEFLEDLNTLDQRIKFTMELEVNGKLPFLDALVIREDKDIKFKVYKKPYSSGDLLNFNSFHDLKVKRGVVIGETIRIGKISDEKKEDWDNLEKQLIRNDYPIKFIKKNMKVGMAHFEKNNNNKNYPSPKKDENLKSTLVLPFEGMRRATQMRKLGKTFGIKTMYKKGKNLKSIFSRTYKEKSNIKAGGIYKIDCECNETYIGETGNKLDTRIKQHIYCVKTLDLTNGNAVHSTHCKKKMKWKEAKFLSYESNWWKRKIKESLFLQKLNPKINLKHGYQLVGKWY